MRIASLALVVLVLFGCQSSGLSRTGSLEKRYRKAIAGLTFETGGSMAVTLT
jgi:hypothetical protein